MDNASLLILNSLDENVYTYCDSNTTVQYQPGNITVTCDYTRISCGLRVVNTSFDYDLNDNTIM